MVKKHVQLCTTLETVARLAQLWQAGVGPLSSCVARAPHCTGLSYCRAHALGAGAPAVATDGL